MSELLARTPQVIAGEINIIKEQTKKLVLGASIDIGRRLSEAKAMIEHGQWGDWLKSSVDYSQSTANNLMRIFEEYGENQLSLIGNDAKFQALGNLSYTQAVALLGIAPEEREEFVEEHDVKAMSTRELQAAVKAKADAEKKAADALEREAVTKRDNQTLSERAKELNEQLINAKAKAAEEYNKLEEAKKLHQSETEKLTKELKAAKAAGADEGKIEQLAADLAEAKAKVEELTEELKTPIEPVTVEKIPEETLRELEDLRARATSDESPIMVKFRIHFESLTSGFGSLIKTLDEMRTVDPGLYDKYKNAVSKLINTMIGKVA